jgi:serine O-acetyltransferase
MWVEILADYRRYPGTGLRRLAIAAISQGFWAVCSYRVAHSLLAAPRPLRQILRAIWLPLEKMIECITGVQIGASARIGRGLYIGHFGGIIVSGRASIGEHCNLSQGVTIGIAGRGENRGAPSLGNRVYVAAGAKLIGRLRVGDDVAVGANAVVTRDVEPGVTVGGVPARVIARTGSQDFIEVG